MLPDRVSNPGPLTYESGALPIALRGPAGPPTYESVVLPIALRGPAAMHQYLITVPKSAYRDAFKKWIHRLKLCISMHF